MKIIGRVTLVLVLLSCVQSTATAEVCRGCDVTAAVRDQHDALLTLTDDQKRTAEQTHFKYGVLTHPDDASNERLLHHLDFVANYDDDLRVPLWAGYRLVKADIVTRTRKDCFRTDPRIPSEACAECADYQDDDFEEDAYDRGHLVPRAAMNRSEASMIHRIGASRLWTI